MSEPLSEDLVRYSAAHRTRERRENGTVKLVGKREKKWEGTYHVYDPQGDGTSKRKRRSRIIGTKAQIPTKAAAEDLHRAWIRRQASQPVADTATTKVAHLCDDYLVLRGADWEEATAKTNQSLFANVIKPAIGHLSIDRVTAEDLKRLVDGLPNRVCTTPGCIKRGAAGKLVKLPGIVKKGISQSYAQKVITSLRAIFDLAHERDLISKNPARSIMMRLRTPRQARKADKSVFPPQYLAPLIAELDIRDTLIVWLSILGATRPNELFAVRAADVGPHWIHIERALDWRRRMKGTKTGKPRFIHLPPELAAEVHKWITVEGIHSQDLLFRNQEGNPVNRGNFVTRRLRPAAVRAKIPVQDIDFRMLRRSFATVAQFVGLDVKAIQSQLGHAKPQMTMREYMQPIDDLTAGQLKRLEDMLRGRTPMPADMAARLGTGTIQ